ncbi:kelch-like protein 11 isoform X1 [Lingula anatina]|uniref:Kelch-like protein 11 isoform X1 n=2 Tax=Lingula anatina TaxID=7574 RepID=A0A1S3H858_LINAN|nr:kelch-like protein 11 isoform X1 [Lingula anatina]|eukprot:XP_013382183.1 kelch-like protein 11 isoform X1 [Lingula anatina]
MAEPPVLLGRYPTVSSLAFSNQRRPKSILSDISSESDGGAEESSDCWMDSHRHLTRMAKALWEQRSHSTDICDITVTIDGKAVKAHLCVLMCCPYFSSLYSSGMKERLSGQVDLSGVTSPETFETVLEYIYLGKAVITEDNVSSILHLADYLQLEGLKDMCSHHFIRNGVTSKNCLRLCILASMYGLHSLYDQANQRLRAYLHEALKEDDVVDLSAESLLDLLKDKNLKYVPTMVFFEALIKWAKHKEMERRKEFKTLFCAIDLSSVSCKDMETVIRYQELVSSDPDCVKHIENYDLDLSLGKIHPDTEEKEVIVISGGRHTPDGTPHAQMYGFVIEDSKWVRLPPMPFRSDVHVCTTLNQRDLYLVRPMHMTWEFYKFQEKDSQWSSSTTVQEPLMSYASRTIICSVTCRGMICMLKDRSMYFTGKPYLCCFNPLNTHIERYFPFQDTSLIPTMCQLASVLDRYVCLLAKCADSSRIGRVETVRFYVVDLQDCITEEYSRGAQYGEMMHVTGQKIYITSPGKRFSKVFDMELKSWKRCRRSLPPFPDEPSRINCMSVPHKGAMFVFGGMDRDVRDAPPRNGHVITPSNYLSCYKYMENQDSWERLPDAPSQFHDSCATVVTLPSSILHCTPDCPHCVEKYKFHDPIFDSYAMRENMMYDDEDEDDISTEDDWSDGELDDIGPGGPEDCCIM